MIGACEVASHERGEATGRVTRRSVSRDGRAITYRERICPVCERVQGIARIVGDLG